MYGKDSWRCPTELEKKNGYKWRKSYKVINKFTTTLQSLRVSMCMV